MPRTADGRRSRKAGLPPGTPVHIGEKKAERIRISVLAYDEAGIEEKELPGADECLALRGGPRVAWVDVDGLHETGSVERIGECFGLHPLTVEDVLNTTQRPKMEEFEDYLYVVLRMIRATGGPGEFISEQVSLVVGRDFVLSFQEKDRDVFDPVRERLRQARGRIRKEGPDFLAYSLLDAVVDGYFGVLEGIGERIEALEETLVRSPDAEVLREIHRLKRELTELRKSVWPLREVISGLQRGETPLFKEHTGLYLRDVYDHTIQVIDTVETYRDMVSGILDIYLSSVSNRLNQVMKVLTIIATIFMPISFIAGVYGMNFRHMPELEAAWGYPAALAVMAAVALGLVYFFRRKRWL